MKIRRRVASSTAFLLAILIAAVTACGKDSTAPRVDAGPTFDSGSFSTGTFVFTFTTDGTFGYRCTLHSGMTGTVVASAAGLDSPQVTIQAGNVFNPSTVAVKTGSYVRWVNSSGANHTVTRP